VDDAGREGGAQVFEFSQIVSQLLCVLSISGLLRVFLAHPTLPPPSVWNH